MNRIKNIAIGKSILFALLLGLFLSREQVAAQDDAQVIDQIVAVVGKNIILESDIENQYLNGRIRNNQMSDT